MMKSYVKFLSRNKLYATIEALGLSVALAFVLILVSYATAEYRVGTNLKQAKELYVAGSGDYLGMTWGTAKEFFPSIPEIKGWTRFGEYYAPQGAMIDGQYYEAKYLAIDPNFSQFMGYKCRGCAPDHLLSDAHQAMVRNLLPRKPSATLILSAVPSNAVSCNSRWWESWRISTVRTFLTHTIFSCR